MFDNDWGYHYDDTALCNSTDGNSLIKMITQYKTAAMKSHNEEIISLNFKAVETFVTINCE